MKGILLASAFLALAIFLQAQTIQPLWERTEATDGSHDFYRLPIIIVDSSHNVIVCGTTFNSGPLHGFVTTKYDSAGNFLWQRRHDTPFGHDYIRAAAVDIAGSVYVGGITTNPFNNNQTQFTVIKYSSSGDTLWQYWYGTYKSGVFSPSALMPDSAQNLLILSSFIGVPPQNSGMLAVKLDPDGNTIWEKVHNEGNYGYGGIAAKRVGEHIVYWGRTGSPEGSRFFAWQISDDGETVATSITEPYTDNFDRGYHIDDFGNLFIGDQYYEYKVTKFGLDGISGWVYNKPIIFPAPIPGHINLQGIASDAVGDVYVSGLHSDATGIIGITTKLSAAGEFLWEHKMTVDGYIAAPRPSSCKWVRDDILLITGTVRTNIDSNYYEPFLLFYGKNGPIQGGISDIEGKRNEGVHIAKDGNFFYIAGMSTPENSITEPEEQFLCKYALGGIVGTASPVAGTGKVEPLKLSPNPFADKFRVSVNHEASAAQGFIEVRNSQGKIVVRKAVSLVSGDNNFEINSLQHLPTGVYSVSLTTSSKVYFAQAVKI